MAGYVRADERRQQLLDAAVAVLEADGLEHLTLRAVAAQAGVRLSALQYIFPSRAALVEALTERVLADARYGQFVVGPGGLDVELHRLVDWFADQFVSDAALAQLVRFDVIDQIGGHVGADPGPQFPGGRPLDPQRQEQRVADIAEAAHEELARPASELGRLFALGHTGLVIEALTDRDVRRYRAGATLLVDAIVELARPTPRPEHP